MPVNNDIIFIIGCPRSGTTLINNLLREHLNIGLANELQLIPKFYPKLKAYGDLTIKKNLNNLVDDMLAEPYFSIFEKGYSEKLGKHVIISKKDILENLPESSFAGVVYSALKVTADQLGKQYVGNKHLSMGLHLDWLIEMFPNCRIIHVIRDGRDCALSLKRMRWGHANAFAAAKLWASHIRMAESFKRKNQTHQFMEFRYEDFLKNPVEEINKIAFFIEGEKSTDNSRFSELAKIVRSDNKFKWKSKMDKKDIGIFQSIAMEELSLKNYEIYPVIKKLNALEKMYYSIENQIVREYKHRFRKDLPA